MFHWFVYLSTLTFIVFINPSISIFSNFVGVPAIPAFAKNTSSRPYLFIASLTTSATLASSEALNCLE